MLILSRKLNESIVIDGQIVVKILRIDRDTVKLGIQAPAQLPVHRQEIHDAILRNHGNLAGSPGPAPTTNGSHLPGINGNGNGSSSH
jgi:carbon storage regulator